jgi:AcrR family transcriptional regulator
MASSIGYENVTTRDIAQKVGINSSSIYYHFNTKASILANKSCLTSEE